MKIMTSVAIVGGGKGGSTILSAFSGIDEFKVLGLCDVNQDAPGMKLARELKVPTFQDLEALLKQPGLEVIIEATGSEKVREQVVKLKSPTSSLIDSHIANVMMTFVEGHERVLKKARSKKEAFRTSAAFLTKTYGKDGVIYFTTDTQKYDFVNNHNFSMTGIAVGEPLVQGGRVQRCIQSRQPISEVIPKNVYGTALNIWVAPIFEDDDESLPVVGTYGVFAPRLHPIIKAFDIFAPIIIDSQPAGAWVGASDLEKCVAALSSDNFKVDIKVGDPVQGVKTAMMTIEQKRRVQIDLSTRSLGNIRMISIPLFDEETGNIEGTFGITIPRNLARDLLDMANKLNASTSEVASVMQEIAGAAGEITITEGKLADLINAVRDNAASISEIVGFTKSVANQTKMLGLNAAIEAARAGEHGRGFGVVAEEIRKLSDESKKTADEIGKLIKEIDATVYGAVQASENTVKQSQEQAAATQEVTASVMEMAQMAERLINMAKSL